MIDYASKRYLKQFISTILILFFIVALVIFVYDPLEKYLKGIVKSKYLNEYTTELLKSNYGLEHIYANQDRLLKLKLLKEVDSECIIYGSSHGMQFGTFNQNTFINKFCEKSLNISVSSAGLHDVIYYSKLILEKDKLPDRIFFEVSPWIFQRSFRIEAISKIFSIIEKFVKINSESIERFIYLYYVLNPFFEMLSNNPTPIISTVKCEPP